MEGARREERTSEMTPKLLLLATVWEVRSFMRHVLVIEAKFREWRKGEREVYEFSFMLSFLWNILTEYRECHWHLLSEPRSEVWSSQLIKTTAMPEAGIDSCTKTCK